MGKAEDTRDEINQITAKLIELGLSDNQKFAVLRNASGNRKLVTFDQSTNFSAILRNRPYYETYRAIKNERDYNVALPDGALTQLQYEFEGEDVICQRLAFFPSPDLTEYQNAPYLYELDAIYAEVVQQNIVATPIRFDFDREAFRENEHPMAHVTIGQYKNCRIPMTCALSPFRFFEFVLGSFYNTAYKNFSADIAGLNFLHPITITANEARRVHIGLECQS